MGNNQVGVGGRGTSSFAAAGPDAFESRDSCVAAHRGARHATGCGTEPKTDTLGQRDHGGGDFLAGGSEYPLATRSRAPHRIAGRLLEELELRLQDRIRERDVPE